MPVIVETQKTIWQRVLPFFDKPWKIMVISVTVSTVVSAVLSAYFRAVPLTGAVIGFVVAAIISYPVGVFVLKYLEIVRRQNIQLQQLNDELDAYDHTVAHNLKNTVNTILLSSQVLTTLTEKDSRAQQYAQRIEKATADMTETIDSLLLLASVREENVPLEAVDMATVVQKAQQRIEGYIDRYQPTIVLPDSWETAVGYEPWLIEVWVNYLSNAMKYGGDAAKITCGSRRLPSGEVYYWIQDNGRGLSEAEKNQLFKRFSQTERVEGHGLGLSIVRQIITRLEGKVGVDSPGKGQGSTFYFTLPAKSLP